MYIKLKVHAAARKEEIIKRAENSYEVWTKAPASEGRANTAVLNMLALQIGVEAKRLRIIKGAQTPSKIVEILGYEK